MDEVEQKIEWGALRLGGWKARWLARCQRVRSRRLAIWMRKPLKCGLPAWVDAEVWSLRLRLATRGNLSELRLLLTPGSLDPNEREALANEVREGEVFVDIGANAGVYTLWMGSRNGGGVRVEAFEPDPELCRRLGENLRRNKMGNVTLHRCALGEHDGSAFLQRDGGNLGQNEVTDDHGDDAIEVQIRRLSAVLAERRIERLAALKIDVEGHESEVLRPYFSEVTRDWWPRMIVCEVPSHIVNVEELEVGRLLLNSGYTLSARGRMNGIFCRI